tara:strand:+ start:241 stop:426 length:186 start_codon:yes stop_codon:yes gene_type:complete
LGVNASADLGFTKRMLINATNLRRTLVKYLGWALLYMGKPFTSVGNWFWKKHRDVLDWGNK